MTGTTFAFASSTSSGCSSRQDTHHDAHTLSSHTLPRMSVGAKRLVRLVRAAAARTPAPACRSAARAPRADRACRPTREERRRSTTKIAERDEERSAFMRRAPRRRRRRGRRAGARARAQRGSGGRSTASEAAERHQQAAAPDPVDERLDVDAHAPRAVPSDRLAERHVEVAREAACRSPPRSSSGRDAW